MNPLFLPFLSYAVVTVVTPGPSNLSASALASRVGFRKALPFILGNVVGLWAELTVSALLSEFLTAHYGRFAGYLKWVGAAYIVWLAVSLFLPKRKKAEEGPAAEWGFWNGLLLVLLNPKGILFAVTTFVSFSALLTGSVGRSLLSALLLALLAMGASCLWALTGAGLAAAFKSKAFTMAYSVLMALLLLYAAYAIVAR